MIPTLHPVSLPETGFLRPHAFPYAGKPWTAQIQSLPSQGRWPGEAEPPPPEGEP